MHLKFMEYGPNSMKIGHSVVLPAVRAGRYDTSPNLNESSGSKILLPLPRSFRSTVTSAVSSHRESLVALTLLALTSSTESSLLNRVVSRQGASSTK